MVSPVDWNGLELCDDLALFGDLVAQAASNGSDDVGPSGACVDHGLVFVSGVAEAPVPLLVCAVPFCLAFCCCCCIA